MLKVSAYSSRELLTVLRGLRNLDREARKHARGSLRTMAAQAWQELLSSKAATTLERLVLVATARVKVSDQNVRLTSAAIGRSRSGGLKPSEEYGAIEWGADRGKQRRVRSQRRGTDYTSTRHTTRQLEPNKRAGRVVYPAAAEIIPRILAMYVQTFVRSIHEALEGKS
jgi:hypothetical protein